MPTKEYYWKNREKLIAQAKDLRTKNLKHYRKMSRERNKKARKLNPDPFRASAKKHYYAHKEKHKQWSKKYYEEHKNQIFKYVENWGKTHKEKLHSYQRNHRKKVKQIVIMHYGGKCRCCGETNIAFLCLDHVNGDGNKHRKQFKGSIYEWVIAHNFPKKPVFQVLCANCNMAKTHLGYCPHKKAKNGVISTA